MTEKRFELNNIVKKGTVSFWDNDKQGIINASGILDLLNNFNDENEQLKSDNNQYKILVESLKNENQKLKLRLKDLGVEYY